MGISFRAAGTAYVSTSTTWGGGGATQAFSLPAGIQVGDFLLLAINMRGPSGDPQLPTGTGFGTMVNGVVNGSAEKWLQWDEQYGLLDGTEAMALYYKIATAADVAGASVSVTVGTRANVGGWDAQAGAWSGDLTSGPIDVHAALTSQAAANPAGTPSITTTGNGETVIGFVGINAATWTFTPAAVGGGPVATKRFGNADVNGQKGMSIFDASQPAAGAIQIGGNIGPSAVASMTAALALVPSPVLSIGTTSLSSETSTQVTLTAGAASGGTAPYTYQWRRATTIAGLAAGTNVGTSSNVLTDTPPTPGTPYYYQCTVTDGASSSVKSNEMVAVTQGADIVGFIGDSILANVPSGGSTPPTNFIAELQRYNGGRAVTIVNQAQTGSKTADWLPGAGTGYLTAAKAAFAAAGVTDVIMRLGTNDARGATVPQVSQATHTANILAIANNLVAAGYRVHLAGPIYMLAKLPNSTSFPAQPGGSVLVQDAVTATGTIGAAVDLLYSYFAPDAALANGSTIFALDPAGELFNYFATHVAELNENVAGDVGLHPTATGSLSIAKKDAYQYAKARGYVPSGSGVSTPQAMVC